MYNGNSMEGDRALRTVDKDIAAWENARSQAYLTIAEASAHLTELDSERRRVLGAVANRHLHAVPTIMPQLLATNPESSDGAA